MTQLSILLAQSVTGAVLTIVALLLAAAVIGYLTAWFYAKSIYTPVIKGLEAEKADLLRQVAGLKEDIRKLNEKVESLNLTISGLEKDLSERDKILAEKDRQINELKNPKK
jgi:peptidoglycan hydrolase CwlO-like protein